MQTMQAETNLLKANRERAAFLEQALEQASRRRISDREQRRLYELEMAQQKPLLSEHAYS